MYFKKLFINVWIVIGLMQAVSSRILLDEPIKRFLGTLEKYTMTQNDVVFLLDESGSIGADKFIEVKLFTKLTAQRLAVSAENSRVAVVTFATETINHIDYIKNPEGKNMCTLLKEIDDIGYVGEWTHTDVAMREAQAILAHARPNSNKIVVLLTDGHSNDGHSPVAVAKELKNSGVIIFAVGVDEVNVEEINNVATSPDHIYILDDFEKITKLNVQLVNDAKEFSMDLVKDPSRCNSVCTEGVDCCDEHANCYCGTITGRYDCACIAGYHGRGHRGQCYKCPKGTYKSEARNSECTECPKYSSTLKEGSTSFNDCVCENGYEKHGNFCKAVTCAVLSAPEGGFLIPSQCNNTYSSQCSFKCRAGFCPFSCSANNFIQHTNERMGISSLPSRTCLGNKKWSGEEFYCERITCTALHSPEHGNHNCTEKDFAYGTTCKFSCDKGYELSGSETRTCLLNSSWTGSDVHCKQISCERLKTSHYLHVKPPACGAKSMPYRTVCQFYCEKGFTLISTGKSNDTVGTLNCEANKKWSGNDKITCQDVTPPRVTCPKPIIIDALPHKGYAEVWWDDAEIDAKDQVSISDVRIIEPKGIKKLPHNFFIGSTKVVYEAIDGVGLSSTCSFTVEVLDKEAPQVISCPSDIEVYHDRNTPLLVFWDAPQFQDNSKKDLIVTGNHNKSGDKFAWGNTSYVHYTAEDKSNNTASCTFAVRVKHYPCPYYDPPANGVVTCDTWEDGRLCSIFCHEGFQLASKRTAPTLYMCDQVKKGGKIEGVWKPFPANMKGFKMPWPDCSRKQKPSSLNVTVDMNYNVDSCSEEVLQKMREKFLSNLKPFRSVYCPKDKGCVPENVNVSCEPATRIKRSVHFSANSNDNYGIRKYRTYRQTSEHVLTITFNMEMIPNVTETSDGAKPLNGDEKSEDYLKLLSNPLLNDLESTVSQSVKEAYNVSTISEPEVHHTVLVICTLGQIEVNNTCVNCPAGTYKEEISGTCVECPNASYQDEERSLSCKPCPKDYATYGVKSKSADDCKAPCQPGTYSKTAFEPCLACPLNTYQERSTRMECLKCSSGLYTWRVGANSSSDCVAPCKPGTFSDTGYEPCNPCPVGLYQDNENQTSCIFCPNRTSTSLTGSKSITDCTEIDICGEHRPCHERSTCIQIDKDYKCICPDGLLGRHCEINIDECANDPCLNNGTCVDGIGSYSCECLKGWSGHQCEINIDDCEKKPCYYGGECIDLVDAYECHCQPGFNGSNCEININECQSNPCQNDGICFDKENGYRCCCAKGYFGQNCEKEFIVDLCDTVSCENGGTCFGNNEIFNCSCLPGFDGEFCESNIDDCADFKCGNGGVCIDGIESAMCICPKDYVGEHCEDALFPEYILNFPSPPSTSNYVELKNNYLLYAITVSFFMRTDFKDPNSRATPISYSYREKETIVDNALTLLDTNNFVLYIQGEALHTEFKANNDSSWHHYAVTWEKMDGKWAFYVDGKSFANGLHVGEHKYMHPGIFILGQEQDGFGDIFSNLESFSGSITEFNVWDYALSEEEIKKISSSCGYVGSIIPWYVARTSAKGDVTISKDVDKCKDIGRCASSNCDCFYSDLMSENTCKYEVTSCSNGTCANGQSCISTEFQSFCNCNLEFEGRRCEYDVDECLKDNGGCQYFCVNDIGSYRCDCPEDMILSDDGKTCKETAFCLMDEKIYPDGETWVKNCRQCACNGGNVQCEEIICNQTSCHPEETMITPPGECCSKCVAWSFCLVSFDNMITTFDSSRYEIEGDCSYTVIEDCIDGRFKVQIEYLQNYTDDNLIIYQDCLKIRIKSNGSVVIDDDIISPPFENEEVVVEEHNATITVRTRSELLIQWNSIDGAYLAVPITNVNKMCGLCSHIEEFYSYGLGKFPLPERTASGEKECFAIFPTAVRSGANVISSLSPIFHTFLINVPIIYFYYSMKLI